MEITNKSSHFPLKLKFLAIFAVPGMVVKEYASEVFRQTIICRQDFNS